MYRKMDEKIKLKCFDITQKMQKVKRGNKKKEILFLLIKWFRYSKRKPTLKHAIYLWMAESDEEI